MVIVVDLCVCGYVSVVATVMVNYVLIRIYGNREDFL